MFAKKLNRYSNKKQWFTIVKFDKFFQIFFIKWTHEKEEFLRNKKICAASVFKLWIRYMAYILWTFEDDNIKIEA